MFCGFSWTQFRGNRRTVGHLQPSSSGSFSREEKRQARASAGKLLPAPNPVSLAHGHRRSLTYP